MSLTYSYTGYSMRYSSDSGRSTILHSPYYIQ